MRANVKYFDSKFVKKFSRETHKLHDRNSHVDVALGDSDQDVISYHLSAQVAGRATLRYMADVYNTVL